MGAVESDDKLGRGERYASGEDGESAPPASTFRVVLLNAVALLGGINLRHGQQARISSARGHGGGGHAHRGSASARTGTIAVLDLESKRVGHVDFAQAQAGARTPQHIFIERRIRYVACHDRLHVSTGRNSDMCLVCVCVCHAVKVQPPLRWGPLPLTFSGCHNTSKQT